MPTPPYIASGTGNEEPLSRFPDWREAVAILIERAFIEALHNVKKSPCNFLHILL